MNKIDLVSKLAKRTGVTKQEAEKSFDTVFEIITEALEEGEKVIVSGFGTFEVKERVGHKGHDPRTKQIIDIPPMKCATFRTGTVLKEKVK